LIDKDGNDSIDKQELLDFFANNGIDLVNDEELNAQLKLVDASGNGNLELGEFKKMFMHMIKEEKK